MVGTLGIAFEELTTRRAVLKLPDRAAFHNHIGGPHAGAMFTLAESASGALVLVNFGDLMASVTPLALHGEIDYLKVAKGELLAVADFAADPAEMLATLAQGERPEFDIPVQLRTPDGRHTGQALFRWTLRANRD